MVSAPRKVNRFRCSLELADTIVGMDPQSFDPLSKVEAEHFRNELIVGLIRKFFRMRGGFLKSVAAMAPSFVLSPNRERERG
jgi:hypothetical protein